MQYAHGWVVTMTWALLAVGTGFGIGLTVSVITLRDSLRVADEAKSSPGLCAARCAESTGRMSPTTMPGVRRPWSPRTRSSEMACSRSPSARRDRTGRATSSSVSMSLDRAFCEQYEESARIPPRKVLPLSGIG